ncbi:hypothetical protein ACI3PL_20740, partial [Lacticaseibacillus paracasei]
MKQTKDTMVVGLPGSGKSSIKYDCDVLIDDEPESFLILSKHINSGKHIVCVSAEFCNPRILKS